MWSCSRKNTMNDQTLCPPVGLKWVCFQCCKIWVFFFNFICLFCLFMQRHVWWVNTLFKLQGCLRERLSTRKWAEVSTAGSVSRQTSDIRLKCIVYCIWNCREPTYCIYFKPLLALKHVSKKNNLDNRWN